MTIYDSYGFEIDLKNVLNFDGQQNEDQNQKLQIGSRIEYNCQDRNLIYKGVNSTTCVKRKLGKKGDFESDIETPRIIKFIQSLLTGEPMAEESESQSGTDNSAQASNDLSAHWSKNPSSKSYLKFCVNPKTEKLKQDIATKMAFYSSVVIVTVIFLFSISCIFKRSRRKKELRKEQLRGRGSEMEGGRFYRV